MLVIVIPVERGRLVAMLATMLTHITTVTIVVILAAVLTDSAGPIAWGSWTLCSTLLARELAHAASMTSGF